MPGSACSELQGAGVARLPSIFATSGVSGGTWCGSGEISIVQTWTWRVVSEFLSVNGLSSVVGKLFRVMSLFPGVSERSWSWGRLSLARTNGLLPCLLRATSEQNVHSHGPGALVTGVDAVTRSVHGLLWCSGWRQEGGGLVNVDNPLCPAHLPQISH